MYYLVIDHSSCINSDCLHIKYGKSHKLWVKYYNAFPQKERFFRNFPVCGQKRWSNHLDFTQNIPKIFHPSLGSSCNNQAITSKYESRFIIKNQNQIIPIQGLQHIIDLTLEFAFCGTDKPHAIYNPIIINKIYMNLSERCSVKYACHHKDTCN